MKLLAKNEKNMKGWGVYLADLKTQYDLKHISVISPSNRRAAWTEGFEVSNVMCVEKRCEGVCV